MLCTAILGLFGGYINHLLANEPADTYIWQLIYDLVCRNLHHLWAVYPQKTRRVKIVTYPAPTLCARTVYCLWNNEQVVKFSNRLKYFVHLSTCIRVRSALISIGLDLSNLLSSMFFGECQLGQNIRARNSHPQDGTNFVLQNQ